jgi:serpin B
MKKQDLLDALELLDDQFVEEADEAPVRRHRSPWQRYAALAACLVLMCGSIIAWHQSGGWLFGGNLGTKKEEMLLEDSRADVTQTSESMKVETAEEQESSKMTSTKTESEQPTSGSNVKTAELVEKGEPWTMDEFTYLSASMVLSEGNELYSPMSLYYALTLAAVGAEGETQQELLTILGETSLESLLMEAESLMEKQNINNRFSTISLSNSMWIDESYGKVNTSFQDIIATRLNAEIFTGKMTSAEMMGQLRTWLAEKTHGVLEYSPIDGDLVMLNTIYYKSPWMLAFEKEATITDEFALENGERVQVSFMTREEMGAAYVGDGYTKATLSLMDGEMVFVLPDEGVSVQEIVQDPARLIRIFKGAKGTNHIVNWKVPKFVSEEDVDLVEVLEKMGADTAFGDNADYSSIAENSEGAVLSSVIQKIRLSIDENGTEAAGYTAYKTEGLTERHVDMILNRPFLYAILDNDDNVLFIGTCMDPTKE